MALPSPLPSAPVPLRVGDRMEPSVLGPLEAAGFARYAGAAGDFNPIHIDHQFAVDAGMPSVFGMGMLPGGTLGARLARWVGPESIRSFSIRFTGKSWPGDRLALSGEVVEVGERDGEPVASIELRATSEDDGAELVRGAAVVRRA
jgi:acyl dehydratase